MGRGCGGSIWILIGGALQNLTILVEDLPRRKVVADPTGTNG